MVDHLLAVSKLAPKLGVEDIEEMRKVEADLSGADVRLQAHHVYQKARDRSRRHSSHPTTGAFLRRAAAHALHHICTALQGKVND